MVVFYYSFAKITISSGTPKDNINALHYHSRNKKTARFTTYGFHYFANLIIFTYEVYVKS